MKRTVHGVLLTFLVMATMLASSMLVNAFYCPFVKKIQAVLQSPGEFCVSDSEGHVTGLVNGTIVSEIPVSDYSDNIVTLSFPYDSYKYRVSGINQGVYGLVVIAVTKYGNVTFSAVDIPISLAQVHQFTIDWVALSNGEKGVTVQVDSDADGIFEREFVAGLELTSAGFLFGNGTADTNKDGKIDIQDVSIVTAAYGSKPVDPNWNVNADLDENGQINIVDVTLVAKDYGLGRTH